MIRNWGGRLLGIGAIGLAIAVVTTSEAASAADFSATDALMARLMAADNVPGAALALIKDGKVILEKGYGFRDLTAQAAVTTTTLFNIGSISKSFTALGIAQLVDRHQVDLDAPVVQYLPALHLRDPQATQMVTLRRLLSHTSGLPADEKWPAEVPQTREELVGEFASMPITAPPGTRFQYCSRCIVLAAYVLERVIGQTWETYTRAQIFEPLGMATASFGPAGLEQVTDRALPYHHVAILSQVPVRWGRLRYLGPLAPGGGINASIDEMARYALLQLGDGTFSGHQLVSAQTMAELHRPEIAVDTNWSPTAHTEDLHYALGWFTADRHGVHIISHNGVNPGFRATIVLVPSAKAGVVILTNGESDHFVDAAAWSLTRQLLQ
jgi:CubicO group peptidase (beta-lactamase class C family)